MLLTKIVKMKWNPSNKKYYINLGYNYTKMGDEFEVKVEDLQDGSHILVDCLCDECKEILPPMEWRNYLKWKHEDGKIYCKKCAWNLYGKEHMLKTKLLKGKSFYNWCTESNRYDILTRWDYKLNNCTPKDILYSTKSKYYFKCPRRLHPSELKNIDGFTSGQEGSMFCNMCNSFAQWGYDNICFDFLEKYWDYIKNVDKKGNPINPWMISFSSTKKIWIKCQEKDYHDSYKLECNQFVNGNRCPYCTTRNGKVHPLDSLGQYIVNRFSKEFLDKIWSNKNTKSPYEYTTMSNQKVWWKCLDSKHEDYPRDIMHSNRYDFRCPDCVNEMDESVIQNKTRLYLEELNYNVLHEERCTIVPINPKTKNPLPFDNEIKLINMESLIVEVNGIQHYKKGMGYFGDNFNLHYQKLKDRYKRFISYINGYEYLEIPYTAFDENDTYKTLINNKISTILKEVS